ncbi:biopolymer transport protein ExbD [Prosthecobacter debontii]|uniref:Biopolymer transport protein ExbD n=1 Tax=Prosthecobacter debontii TaxID=48467 RepID=A0A1T4YYG3_9BACT|nr:biopolymer transporter ExbD [Prosthecobacter debontii]SKB06837.1 biopolymer transport protein ExbD [Prosthecobacter debontii]
MKLESHLPRQSPWLYITPLLNAILLLLVYFLFSSGFVIQSGITVEKPRSSSRLTGFDRAHIITLAPGNEVPMYFDGRRVSLDELTQKLVEGRSGERRVIIHHDRQAPSGRVVEVINLAQELGYEAAISTTPSPPPLAP